MLPTKFGVRWPFGSGEEDGNGSHLVFLIRMIKILGILIYYFDLLVTPMLPIKFLDNRPSVSEEEEKNRFSRWWLHLHLRF